MRRKLTFLLVIIMLISMPKILLTSQGKAFAEVSDGTYSIDYQVSHAKSDSVSISNDYFEKPAILIMENGKKYMEFTLNHSEWTKELQAPLGGTFVDVDVVSENKEEDTRVVKFEVEGDLSKPLEFKMHALIESMEPVYDHRYTVRFDFDTDTMEEVETAESNPEEADNDMARVAADNANEKQGKSSMTSGNATPLIFIVFLVILVLLIYRLRKRNISKKN